MKRKVNKILAERRLASLGSKRGSKTKKYTRSFNTWSTKNRNGEKPFINPFNHQKPIHLSKPKWYHEPKLPVWISALATVLTTLFIFFQLGISRRQSVIFHEQTSIFQKQTNLIDAQNNLLNFQNERISQQTNLQEAERRSSVVYLFSNVLDKIDEELKNKQRRGEKRVLSTELIARIASLTQALKPYKYLNNDTIISRAVSPEKGQLLSALINFDLNQNTYDSIFKKSNFQSLELENAYLNSTVFNKINLANSVLLNCNISNSVFNDATLSNVIFSRSNIANTVFQNANLVKSEIKSVQAENAKFLGCTLEGVSFSGSNLQKVIFDSGKKLRLEFGEILYGQLSNTSKNLKILDTIEKFDIIYGGESTYTDNRNNKMYYHTIITEIDINDMPFDPSLSNMKKVDFSYSDLTGTKIFNYKINESNFQESIITSVEFSNISVWKTDFKNAKLDLQTFNRNFKFQINGSITPIAEDYNLVAKKPKEPMVFEVIGATVKSENSKGPYTHILELKTD